MNRSFQDQSAHVLIVDHDPADRNAMVIATRKLDRPTIETHLAKSLHHAIEILESTEIDICFCNYHLWGNETALDLLHFAQHRGIRIPIVTVTGFDDIDPVAHELIIAGFDDVLHKNDLMGANLYRMIRNSWLRNRQQRHLEQNAMRDALTGLQNRRSLEIRLKLECNRLARHASDLSVMFLDLDNFRQINNEFGRAAGDQALRRMAEVLQESVRKVDLAARFGGDEFAVVLPNCPLETAKELLNTICRKIEQEPIEFESHSFPVLFSAGIAMFDPHLRQDSPYALIKAADEAMYREKELRKKARTAP